MIRSRHREEEYATELPEIDNHGAEIFDGS